MALSSIATTAAAGLGQWTNIAPPIGASIVALDPTQPANVYAVDTNGTVYESTSSGLTWAETAGTLPDNPSVLIVDPLLPSRLYAAIDGDGVYVSLDAGQTWTQSNTGLPTTAVRDLVLHPSAAGTAYCAARGAGVFETTNGGASWSLTGTSGLANLRLEAIAIDPANPATLYAGMEANLFNGEGALYKSTDGGATWAVAGLTESRIGGSTLRVYELTVDPMMPQTLYAVTGSHFLSSGTGISKSTDGGATFTNLGPAISTTHTLALDPANPMRVYAGTSEGVYTSDDGALTWTPARDGLDALVDPSVTHLSVDPTAPSTVYAVAGATVFKTTDARHWTFSGNGLRPSHDSEVIALDPLEPTRIQAWLPNRGFWASADSGASWTPHNLGLPRNQSPASIAVDPQTPSVSYVAFAGKGVFKSVDRATTFHPANSGLPSLEIAAVAIDPMTPSILYAGGSAGLFRSADGGGSWSAASAGLSGEVQSIAVDPVTTSTVYAGTEHAVYKSIDGGASWMATALTVPTFGIVIDRGVRFVVIDASAPLTLYAETHLAAYCGQPGNYYYCGAFGLHKSVDGGSSWISISTGLGPSPVTGFVIDPQTPTTLYAATSGVLRSVDGGASWIAFAPGPGGHYPRTLAIDPQRPSWLYATSIAGLFRIEGPCAADGDCTDGNPCTTDTCNLDGSCTNAAVANGTSCDDDDACTPATQCASGWCVPAAAPVSCDAADECSAQACAPTTGSCVTALRSDGAECDDGNACFVVDRCGAGICAGIVPVECSDCLTCEPSTGCVEMPDPTCAEPAPAKATVTVKAQPPNGHSISWNWKSAAPMSFADFGNPLASTDYSLCVYASSAGVPALVLRERITEPSCVPDQCWTQAGTTLKYKVRTYTGITNVKLKTNGAGTGVIKVKGKGLEVDGGLPLAVDPNVIVQLRRTDAPACWQATYPTARSNGTKVFKAKVP